LLSAWGKQNLRPSEGHRRVRTTARGIGMAPSRKNSEVGQEYVRLESPQSSKWLKWMSMSLPLLVGLVVLAVAPDVPLRTFRGQFIRPRRDSDLQTVPAPPGLEGEGAVAAEEPPLGSVVEGCFVNIILVRHCNKRPPWDPHPTPMELCTEQGLLRGENMARIFGKQGRFPEPTRLFARRMPQDIYSSRDMYLLWPLAQRYGVLVNTTFAPKDVLAMADTLLEERPELCGQTVVVSWDHCSIPALAQALGCFEEACTTCWDDRDYDTVLWLRFEASTEQDWRLSLQVSHEEFGGFDGPSSYRECIDNPIESSKFGKPCTWLKTWLQ